MNLREEQTNDATSIRNVHLKAFETDTESTLVYKLRKSDVETISLVVDEGKEIIGHILFSPVTIEEYPDLKIMGLAPMAVLPGWQQKGVGSLLVNKGLKTCKERGYSTVVVLGFPDYYGRFGFKPSIDFGIRCEYDVSPDVFMAKELQKGALKNVKGTVKYHEVFNDL